MSALPFVSVIIPCLNEKSFIGKCLDSIIAQDYPKDKLEILVVDGMSEDGTRGIVERYANRYPFIKPLDNPKKITPAGLNIGIQNAKGEIIVRMDAHSSYEKDYISKCIKYLNEYNADNVGGVWITVPRNNSFIAKAIAYSLSHPFGVGNAHYRIGQAKEPTWVDTVPYGCYYKEVFKKIGLFDETLPRNEDIDFNSRLRKAGGKILLVPEIVMYYYARSTFNSFLIHNFANGITITNRLKLNRIIFSWRHLVPLVFVSSLVGSSGLWGLLSFLSSWGSLGLLGFLSFVLIVGLYTLCNIYFSTKIALRERDLRYFFIMPIIFVALHIAYGLGSVYGLFKLILSRKVGLTQPKKL
jgi:glycosyltransferase involved in cell wall biosynthesis